MRLRASLRSCLRLSGGAALRLGPAGVRSTVLQS
jgi:hypothetical protein